MSATEHLQSLPLARTCVSCQTQFAAHGERQPWTLACGDNVCRVCLGSQVVISTEEVSALADIHCRACHQITKAGHPLIINTALVRHMTQHPLSPAASEPGPSCENCSSRDSLKFCTVCRLILCGSCDAGEHGSVRQQGHLRISMEGWKKEHIHDCPDCDLHDRYRRFPRNLVCCSSECSRSNQAICLLCLAEGEAHSGCQHEFVEKIVAPRRAVIAEMQSNIASSETGLLALISHLRDGEIQTRKIRDGHIDTVRQTSNNLNQEVEQRRHQLISSLETSSSAKLQSLATQLQSLRSAAQEIYQLLEQTEQLENEPDTTVVSSAEAHLTRIDQYQATVGRIPLRPCVETVDQVLFPTAVGLRYSLEAVGIVQNIGKVTPPLYDIFQTYFPISE